LKGSYALVLDLSEAREIHVGKLGPIPFRGDALDCVPGFGCTDCRCRSHLYHARESDDLMAQITQAFLKANLRPKLWLDRGGAAHPPGGNL
jgi:Uri superfamily endonuclease